MEDDTQPDPKTDVSAVLSSLRDSLAEEEHRIRAESEQAMRDRELATAASVFEFAERLLYFREKVDDLIAESEAIAEFRDMGKPAVQEIVGTRFFGRPNKSREVTMRREYCPYLLEVLVDLGGSGEASAVVDAVGVKMKDVLKPSDYYTPRCGWQRIRWRNAVHWARNQMVHKDGRMRSNSIRGIWEISDKGREWLAQHKGK